MLSIHGSLRGLGMVAAIVASGTAVQAEELAGGKRDGELDRLASAIAGLSSDRTAVDLEPLTTEGYIDNARLLRDGQAAFALVDSLSTYWVGNGAGPFDGDQPFEDLRVVATLWYEVDHFVVGSAALQSGTIADFADLDGARVSLSDENATQINANLRVLDAFGADVDVSLDIDALTGPESVQRLDYGQISGLAMTAPMPSPSLSVVDALEAMPNGGVLVGLTSGQFAGLAGSRQGAWLPYTIPAGTYPGQNANIDTTARPVMLAVRADVDDENVYQVVKSLFSNLPGLADDSVLAGRIRLENAVSVDLPFPLHPGAARYFQQIGLITENDVFARLQTSQDPLSRRDSTIDPWKAYRPLQSILFSGTPESERSRTFVSFFDFGSVELDEPAAATVDEIAAFADGLPNAEIFVAGHTDSAGSKAVNERVAKARADSVIDRLIEQGYDRDLISSAAYGEDRPAVSTADEEQHLQNRRVETVVTLPAGTTPAVAVSDQETATGTGGAEPAVTETAEADAGAESVDGSAEAPPDEGQVDVAAVDSAESGLPTLLVDGISATEGSGGLSSSLRLSAASDLPVVLVVTRLNGTAKAGSDFESTPNVITLRPGETEVVLETVLIDDDLAEGDETFELKISGSENHVEIPEGPIVLMIEDDD